MKFMNFSAKAFIIFSLISFFALHLTHAQDVQINVQVPPPYSTHLEDYIDFPDQGVVTLTNLSQNTHELKLITSVVGDNGINANIKTSWIPISPILLGPMEVKILTAMELKSHFSNVTENDTNVSGVDIDQVIRTESLPEGSYTVCLKALSTLTNTQISNEFGCTRIFLTHYDPPIILLPGNESTVLPLQPQLVNFTWTPSGVGGTTRYRLHLVDMTENGLFNPNDAFGPDIYIQPFFDRSNIVGTTFPYTVGEPPLQLGHEYAIQVTAYDPMGNLAYKNGGKSPVSTFKYKQNQIIIPPNDGIVLNNNPPDEEGGGMDPNFDLNNDNPNVYMMMQVCQEAINFNNNTAINGSGIFEENSELQLGSHTLLLTENITWNGNKLSGFGKIKDTWFKIPILVEFEDLKVNSDGVVIDGFAKARDDNNSPTEWINDLADVQFGNQQVQNLIQKLTVDKNTRVIEWPNTKNIGVGMPVAIERNIGGSKQMIGIVGMHFGVGGSALNAVAQIKIPSQNQEVILGASGVCFDQSGFTNDAFLFLAQDYTIAPGKAVSLLLKAGNQEDPSNGTYIAMTTKGFEEMQLDAKLTLSAQKVKPVEFNPDGVSASFKIKVDNFHNFMVDGLTLPDFEIVGLKGFQFGITNLSYDHSDLENPQNMQWPVPQYTNMGELWQGFYMNEINVKIPEKLNASTTFTAENIVFDDDGFSGHFIVDEILGTGEGKMGSKKWPFSMENLDIKVLKNELISAGFDGRISIPIQEKEADIGYTALIDNQGDDLAYQFVITPEDNITFPAIIAQATIDADTYIDIKDEGNGFEPSFHFYGDLTLNTAINAGIQNSKFKFKSMEVNDFVVDKTGFHLGDGGSIAFTSPQKEFAGFNAGLNTFAIKNSSLSFGFWVKLSEESNVVGGTCGLTIQTKWNNNNTRLVYDKVSIDSILIQGDVGIAKIDGRLVFMYDDPTYGDGFQGNLGIELQLQAGNGGGLGIETDIMFGNKNELKYFYFAGSVDNLPVGIPISASMRLYGFMGGFYHHMKIAGDTYVPDAETVFGVKAGVALGLDVKKTFHAKCSMEANFTSDGLGQIDFIGDAYVMTDYQPGFTPYDPPPSAHLGLKVYYSFPDKIFAATLGVDVNYAPAIVGGGDIEIYSDAETWWIKAGSPATTEGPDPLNITVLQLYNFKSYFMAGHNLGDLPPPPNEVLAMLGNAKLENTRKNGMLSSGKGLAYGSQIDFDTGDLEAWVFYANLKVIAGFDLMLQNEAECNDEPAGINGWYANGSAYAYMAGAVGIKFQFCESCKVRRVSLGELSVAALIEMGAPNPFWADGYAAGSGSVLGVFEGDFDFHVSYGDFCEFTPKYEPSDTLAGLTFIQDVLPRKGSEEANEFNVFGKPEVLLTFSANDNKVYSMPQEDEEANIYTRYFKFPLKKLVLSIDDPNSNDHGKVLAEWGKNNLQGSFKQNYTGETFIYESDAILPSHTQFKLEVVVNILEKQNGVWVAEKIDDNEKSSRTIWFTTGAEPKKITDDNVEFCFPGRFQRYYLQQDGNYVGYIKTIKEYQEMFDLEYDNNLYGEDKILVKLIPLDGGEVLEGEFLGYENQRVFFRHPPLKNNKMYAFQLIKEEPPSQWLQNNPPQDDDNDLNANLDLGYAPSLYETMTKKQQLLGQLKLETRQRELYKYVFRTSNYDRLGTKITTAPKGQLDKADIPVLTSIVEFNIDEPFDKYDRDHLLRFNWNPEYGAAYWYNNYLMPHVYQDFYDLQDILDLDEPHNTITPSLYMDLLNPVPKLTQAEVNAKLAEEVVPYIGQNMQNDMIILNAGLGNNPPASNTPKHLMSYYGDALGYYTYKYLLMPMLYDLENPIITECMLAGNDCQADLKAIMLYHTLNDKEYRRIGAGIYQTLVGYKVNTLNAWDVNDKFGIEWAVPMGIGN